MINKKCFMTKHSKTQVIKNMRMEIRFMDLVYSTIDFYNNLKLKYKDYLKPEIISIVIIQSKEEVFLETIEVETIEGGLEKQTVKRTDLGFITDGENNEDQEAFFNTKDSIEVNLRKFINEITPYDIINTMDLFHNEACEKINKKYNTFGIDS